ncbi:MAG: ferredoxin [Bacillales bacterium]|nr:ferredoxin [Bacillales bacterium]
MAKKVTVNKDVCVGCGLCTSMADSVLAIGDDGLAEAIADVTPDTEDAVNEAVASCPVQAIEVE